MNKLSKLFFWRKKPVEINEARQSFRTGVATVEQRLAQTPGAMFGDCFPLTHTFAEGLYVREIRCPAGSLIVTKIFKQTHATFLLSGECSVLTENGVQKIKAPFSMITKVGTKRIIYCHTDVVWTTVHHNPSNTKNLDKIEKNVIAKNFKEADDKEIQSFMNDIKKLEV
jgi:hypothetical protein